MCNSLHLALGLQQYYQHVMLAITQLAVYITVKIASASFQILQLFSVLVLLFHDTSTQLGTIQYNTVQKNNTAIIKCLDVTL